LNEKPGIASTRLGLGLAVLLQGGYRQARSFMVESLALYRQQSMGPGVIGCLEGMAGLAVAEGDPERAARLLGAVEALREDASMSAPGIHSSLLVRWEEETRARLGAGGFEAARDAGRTMKADEAIAYALAQC
jgi:hypothetical protein